MKKTRFDQRRKKNHSFTKGSQIDKSANNHKHFTSFGQTLKKNKKILNTSLEKEGKTLKKKLDISNLKINEAMDILEDFSHCDNLQNGFSKESLAEFEKVQYTINKK